MPKSEGSIVAVLRLAVLSRLLVLALILLFRLLFHPYDTSSSLNPPCLPSSSSSAASPPSSAARWPRIGTAIERSVVWDGVYFVRIAECGYEYEQTYAFLPLLPACIALLSRSVFAPLVPVIGYRAVLALSGYVLNNVAFVFAAVYLYRLSVLILKDTAAALRASVLFCFNPASIFYSSIYSESLYALFSLGGIFYLFSGANTIAMLLLALSGSARSNGALNAGYFCFQAMHQAYDAIILKKGARLAVQAIVAAVARSAFVFIPFISFQAYGYFNICLGVFSDELSPWCKARVPNLYGYLQSHYWGVGFLKYFQVKQLPNFLLASPILSLSFCSIIQYANFLPHIFRSLSMQGKKVSAMQYFSGANQTSDAIDTSKEISKDSYSSKRPEGTIDRTVSRRKKESREKGSESFQDLKPTDQEALDDVKQGYYSILVLPFILHLGFMTFTAFFVMHVQVATRFLSASPSIYWFASYLLISHGKTSESPTQYTEWKWSIASCDFAPDNWNIVAILLVLSSRCCRFFCHQDVGIPSSWYSG